MNPATPAIRRPVRPALWCLLPLALTSAAHAVPKFNPAGLDVGLSLDYANGALRDLSATRALTTTLVTRYNTPEWQFGIDLPYLVLEEAMPPGSATANTKVRGWGDVGIKVRRTLWASTQPAQGVDLTLKVKTKTGNAERGLGTGGTDVALQLEGYRAHRNWLFFGHIGQRKTGDSSVLPPASNPVFTEMGVQKRWGQGTHVGLFHNYRQANGRSGALSEATVFYQTKVATDVVQLSVTKGFTDASPNWGVGVAYTVRF